MDKKKKDLDKASGSVKIWIQEQGYGLSFVDNKHFVTGISSKRHENCERCFGIMSKNAHLGDKDVLGFLHVISSTRWIFMVDKKKI